MEGTLISCLSSDVWLFGFSSLLSLRLFLLGKKKKAKEKRGGGPQTKKIVSPF